MDNVLMKKEVLNIDKSTWKLTKLGDLLEDISQRVDNPAQSGYERFVGLEHFVSGDIKIRNWGTTENLTSSTKAFKAGDLLFARRNAYLRRASLVDFDGCCSGDAFVLRENHNKVVPGFMAFFFNSNAVWNFANENAAGTMSQRVKWRDLANYEFLLPPKDHQAQLAELLWAMDEVVQKQTETQKKIQAYLMSFRLNFIGKLAYNGHTIVQIKDIGTKRKQAVQVGPFGGSVNSRHFVSSGVPVIKINNINEEGELDLSNLVFISKEHTSSLKRYCIESGDILTAAQATTGRTAIADSRIEGSIISQHLIRISADDTICYPEYLYEVFSSDLIKNQINLVKAKTTRDGLNTEDVANFRIPLPNLDLQRKFVNKIAKIRKSLKIENSHLNTSMKLQKSIINTIF